VIIATLTAVAWGFIMVLTGDSRRLGILINCFWALYNVLLLSAAPYAALWQPPDAAANARQLHDVETVRTLRGAPSAR
jgi:hypothetical protein